jgi:hypothetical protein
MMETERKEKEKERKKMAIFTKPRVSGGVDVVGTRMVCDYQGSKDPAPLHLEGIVKSQRKIEGKGNLLVVQTADGFRSIYFEKATNVRFTLEPNDPRWDDVPRMRDTDDGYDRMRDSYNETYGYGAWKSRRYR